MWTFSSGAITKGQEHLVCGRRRKELEYPVGEEPLMNGGRRDVSYLWRSLLRGDRVARLDTSLSEPDRQLRRLASLPHVPRTARHLLLRTPSHGPPWKLTVGVRFSRPQLTGRMAKEGLG